MRSILLGALVVLGFNAHALVYETNHMADALSQAQVGDLVVLDIDNTILTPTQTLGSDQWYDYRLKGYKAQGLAENDAIDSAIADWLKVQNVTNVKPIEPVTPIWIRQLQAKGIPVLALTARPKELSAATHRQLRSIGVQLKVQGSVAFTSEATELSGGVLFVGPRQNKGLVLQEFLQKSGFQPKHLIFADDKEKHVLNMEKVFASMGDANSNYRYGAADAQVKAFSATIAEKQWNVFLASGLLISDADASQEK